MVKLSVLLLIFFVLIPLGESLTASPQSKPTVLIIDGDNPHNWRETTLVIKEVLLPYFEVNVVTLMKDQKFNPDFSLYDVLLSNYNGLPWSKDTKNRFEAFVRDGGGFVAVHAANNAFPNWQAYNEIIGLGGWNGRTEKNGSYLRIRDKAFVSVKSSGPTGSHGVRHEFLIMSRNPNHPIMKGIPYFWMHSRDELYDRLRGPAKQLEVLGSAYSQSSTGGSGEHEPVLMAINYGKGRVFHSVLGHNREAMSGLGFQITLQRGTEWAATGKVTISTKNEELLNDKYAAYRNLSKDHQGVWLSLFNGHDLKGWIQRNGHASYTVDVDEGAIVGRTSADSPNSFLCTKEDFKNFELKFDVMVDYELNSGVQIRSRSKSDYQNFRVHGPQIEINAMPEGSSGYVYSEATGRGWLSQNRDRQDLLKNEEWNQFHVKAQGAHIQTWINGVQVADLVDEKSFQSGFIGLQVHSIPKGKGPYKIRWRKLFLRRLGED